MQENNNDEETYYKVRSIEPKNSLENAQKFYYLRKTCFRGMMRYNKKGEFNIPYGRYKNCNFDDLLDERYVNVLKNMIKRHTTVPYEFHCFTEDPKGLDADIKIIPFPKGGHIKGWWSKLAMFQDDIGIQGTILYLDLDVIVFNVV